MHSFLGPTQMMAKGSQPQFVSLTGMLDTAVVSDRLVIVHSVGSIKYIYEF